MSFSATSVSDSNPVLYRFDAYDSNLEINVYCYIHLVYSPSAKEFADESADVLADTFPSSSASSPIGSMTSSIVLGEFSADDLVHQAYDWYKGQYGVLLDDINILDFLSVIEKYRYTQFVSVVFDIHTSEFSVD